IAKLGEDLEAAASDAQAAFNRLIAVGVAGERNDLRLPAWRGEGLTQQRRSVLLHHDALLEIETGAEAQIFVRGPRITVDAAVLAAAVGMQAEAETQVRTVVLSQGGATA